MAIITGNTLGAVENSIILYCQPANTVGYIPFRIVNNSGNFNQVLAPVTLNYGDSICYQISTTDAAVQGNASSGSARLSLVLGGSFGFNAILGTPDALETSINIE